jgi:hypothetical protein
VTAAPPPAPPSGPPTGRVRVRDALRRLFSGGEWPFASWTVLQNRLLDEVGGDLRPLVALLVRAGEAGLVDRLPASRAAWPQVRGALVLSLTNDAFLQPEMARWAVECWAFAAGVAEEGDLTAAADARASVGAAAAATAAAPAPSAAARPAPTPRAAAAVPPRATPRLAPVAPGAGLAPAAPPRRAGGPSATAPASPAAPSAAPAGLPPLVVTYAARPAGAVRPRNGRLPTGLDNPIAVSSLLGIVGFAGYVVYSAAAMPVTRDDPGRAPAALPPAVALAAAAEPTSSPGIPGVTTHGLPQTAADSDRMIRVVPARRPTLPLEQVATPAAGAPAARVAVAVAPPAAPLPAPPAAPTPGLPARPAPAGGPPGAPAPGAPAPGAYDGFDRLRLRDGRVLRGRVELVRVSAVVFREADTGLRYEYPKADVDAVVTEFGSVVRFSPAAADPATAAGAAARAEAALVRRGVAGRYRVRYALVSVDGSPECRRGWDQAPPPAWARVDHQPGADTLAIAFEGGATFASVIDAQAQFASTFVIVPDQAYSGSALTTRLNGRFAPGAFDAAVTLVGYRRVRAGRDVACHTVLRAEGRLAPAPAAPAGGAARRTGGR